MAKYIGNADSLRRISARFWKDLLQRAPFLLDAMLTVVKEHRHEFDFPLAQVKCECC